MLSPPVNCGAGVWPLARETATSCCAARLIQRIRRPHTSQTMTSPRHRHIAVLLLCLAGFCLTLALFHPGFMSYDSVEQLLDARTGQYGDWHPPFMALLWRQIDRVIPGAFGML